MEQNADISKELREISNMMADLGKTNVYQVPGGYFETLPQQILAKIYDTVAPGDSAAEEIREISPLLAALKNKQVLSVPAGYFERLTDAVSAGAVNQPSPVFNIARGSRKWMNYAAAAMIAGIIGISVFFFTNGHAPADKVIAQKSPSAADTGLKDIPDTLLSDYIAAMPGNQDSSLDSADAAFYNTAFIDLRDKDLAGMIQEIPDDDLFSYQDDMQIRSVSL